MRPNESWHVVYATSIRSREDWISSDVVERLIKKGLLVPKLTIEGIGEFDIPEGKRLVLALKDEAAVDQLHACGGNARCTTCRVEFVDGEPQRMTAAEKSVLSERGLTGVRLSCQIPCEHDMTVRVISRLEGSGRQDCGHQPEPEIHPQPVEWVDRD